MMANMIPIAKAHPIWKKVPYAVTPSSLWELSIKLAIEQSPEKLDGPCRTHQQQGISIAGRIKLEGLR